MGVRKKMARKKLHSGLILSPRIMNSHCVEFNTLSALAWTQGDAVKKSVGVSLDLIKAPLDI